MTDELDAGTFSTWLGEIIATLRHGASSHVACGDCTGCCASGYFIPVHDSESDTITHIPRHLLVHAPGLPAGHRLLAHDRKGKCPMLIDGACTIYSQRPQTCRTYDCRIFAAAGIMAGDHAKSTINARVRRWKFRYPEEQDIQRHQAIMATAQFLAEHRTTLPEQLRFQNETHHAILAIRLHEAFLDSGKTVDNLSPSETNERIAAILEHQAQDTSP